MKATVHKILSNSIWCVCPQKSDDLFFGICDVSYEYIKKNAVSLYKYSLIDDLFLNGLKENQVIEGDLIREEGKIYFIPRDARYKNEEETKINNVVSYYASTAIKAILGNEKWKPLTMDQYEYIKNLAIKESSIRSYVVNGFTIGKYLVYYKKCKNGSIQAPQVKIIH